MIVACLALSAGGAYLAYSEARSYLAGGVLPHERFDALSARAEVIGFSNASKKLVLDNCFEGIVGIYARTRDRTRRAIIAAECLSVADAVVATTPVYSYAWYVGALAAAQVRDADGLATRLRQSQVTGPTEQWIAELRVGLVEDHRVELPPDVLALNDKDLAILVLSSRGIASIAARYVRDPSFRDRITTITETLPPQDQQRFLDQVRRVAGITGED